MFDITQGFLCYCSSGELGLVVTKDKVRIGKDLVYKGIHLGKAKFGKPWQSKAPHIVAMIDLGNGNIKVPGVTQVVDLPNAKLIRVIPPSEYGLGTGTAEVEKPLTRLEKARLELEQAEAESNE